MTENRGPAIPANFAEFWPYYVCEHADPRNRRLHFAGTFFTLVLVAAAVYRREPWLLLGMPLFGYGFAWAGHFFIEHNKPATFHAPLKSLLGDFKMFGYMIAGKMDAEVERCRALEGARRGRA